MLLDPKDQAAFKGYVDALRSLEASFREAGVPLSFYAFEAPLENKMVQIIRGKAVIKTVCIEGDNPAQAVKDVAAAVEL
jgi:hypothetical protein